jgi:putative transposase
VPQELNVHCIADNYAIHKHPKVRAWLAQPPRRHMHFVPTYSSWLNQVERFFAIITDKAIRRGSFNSVKELTNKPFSWTATADSILGKTARLCGRITGTGH